MTKSPRAVAREALRLAQETLPAYSSKFSRKDFTQHQLFAVLALKTFLKADYRGVAQVLTDFAELREDLGLAQAPHYSTLCYAAKRLLARARVPPACPHPQPHAPRRPVGVSTKHQTLRSQTQSKPMRASRSSSASGMSSSVARRPKVRDNSVSQTRVLTW